MNDDELATLLTQAYSMTPQDALERTAGCARLLVEWSCLWTVYSKSEGSRLSRTLGEVRYDDATRHFVAVRSGSGWFSVPKSSVRLDAAGRLETFSLGEIPLDEVIFELTGDTGGWRALAYSPWSNTTIVWLVANGKAFERLAALRARTQGDEIGEGSCFLLGAERHPAIGWMANLAGGARVARVRSRLVHRETLGQGIVRLELELPGSITVELNGSHVPPMQHPFEADLTTRRVKPKARSRTIPETADLDAATEMDDAVRPRDDDDLNTWLRASLLHALNDDAVEDAEEVELRLSAALVVVAKLSENQPESLATGSRIETLLGVVELVGGMRDDQLHALLQSDADAG